MSDLARIQQAARIGQVLLSSHARDEMDNANVRARDIERAILTASICIPQENRTKFRLEGGKGIDGEDLIVVVKEIQPGLYVITVF